MVQVNPDINLKLIKRILHKGNYQLPIYADPPAEHKDVTYKQYTKCERVPTASVLLRVDYASIDYSGNFISITDQDP